MEEGLIVIKDNTIDRLTNILSLTSKLLINSLTELIPFKRGIKWRYCKQNKEIII